MRKFSTAAICILGLLGGGLLLWYGVFPLIGSIFKAGIGFVAGLF